MKPLINIKEFESWLLKHFGKPCKTTNLRCYKCRWWNAYYHLDAIVEEYQETEEYWQRQNEIKCTLPTQIK